MYILRLDLVLCVLGWVFVLYFARTLPRHIGNLKDSRSRLRRAAQNPRTDVTALRQDYYAYLTAFSLVSALALVVFAGVVNFTVSVVLPKMAELLRFF